jgi:integrase
LEGRFERPTKVTSLTAFKFQTLLSLFLPRTIQKLAGHKDVSTTMIYTDMLNRGGSGVASPADRL